MEEKLKNLNLEEQKIILQEDQNIAKVNIEKISKENIRKSIYQYLIATKEQQKILIDNYNRYNRQTRQGLNIANNFLNISYIEYGFVLTNALLYLKNKLNKTSFVVTMFSFLTLDQFYRSYIIKTKYQQECNKIQFYQKTLNDLMRQEKKQLKTGSLLWNFLNSRNQSNYYDYQLQKVIEKHNQKELENDIIWKNHPMILNQLKLKNNLSKILQVNLLKLNTIYMQINFDYFSDSSIDSDYDLPESLQEKIDYQKSDVPFLNNQYQEFSLDFENDDVHGLPQPPKSSYHILQKRKPNNLLLDLEQIKEEESIDVSEIDEQNTKRTFCFSKAILNSQQSIDQQMQSFRKLQDPKKSPFHKEGINISFSNDLNFLNDDTMKQSKKNNVSKNFQKKVKETIEDIPVMEETVINVQQKPDEKKLQSSIINLKIKQKTKPKYQKKKSLIVVQDEQKQKTIKRKKQRKKSQRMSIQPILKIDNCLKKRYSSQSKNENFESFINLYQQFHTDQSYKSLKQEKTSKKKDKLKKSKKQKQIDIFLNNNSSTNIEIKNKQKLKKLPSDNSVLKTQNRSEDDLQKVNEQPLTKNFYSKTTDNFFQKTLFGKHHKTINFEKKKLMNVTNIINSGTKKKKKSVKNPNQNINSFQHSKFQCQNTNFDRSIQDVHRNYFQSLKIQNRYDRIQSPFDFNIHNKYKVPKNKYKTKNYSKKIKPVNQSTNIFQNSIDFDLKQAYKESSWLFKKKTRFTHHQLVFIKLRLYNIINIKLKFWFYFNEILFGILCKYYMQHIFYI